jgi:hypothetical protein
MSSRSITRALTALAVVVGAALIGAPTAGAVPGTKAPVQRGWAIDATGKITALTNSTEPAPPAAVGAPDWGGWRIARGIAVAGTTSTTSAWGFVLDGFGGLHEVGFGVASTGHTATGGPYWNGWDIARGVALLPNGTGGVIVDGFGALHGFGVNGSPAPVPSGGPYWKDWDIARSVAIARDGTGGWVVDAFGAVHPFSLNGASKPDAVIHGPYWYGIDYVRGFHVTPDGAGAYFLGRWGVTYAYPVGDARRPNAPQSSVFAPTEDLMRGMAFMLYEPCGGFDDDGTLVAGC